MTDRQCGLCGLRRPLGAFDRKRKDCRECRVAEALRPARGHAPIERALTLRGAFTAIRAAGRARSRIAGTPHAVDHAIPVRAKVRHDPDDWVLICGLDIPANRQIIPAHENAAKWMHFGHSDAKAEERRLMMRRRPPADPG